MDYEVDIHGLNVIEAKVLLNNLLNSLSPQYDTLIVIHGYHTHILKDFVRHSYKHKRIERVIVSMNPGETILQLRREY